MAMIYIILIVCIWCIWWAVGYICAIVFGILFKYFGFLDNPDDNSECTIGEIIDAYDGDMYLLALWGPILVIPIIIFFIWGKFRISNKIDMLKKFNIGKLFKK